MKLKDQVCSLDLAKRLKGLGVKQESLWAWWIATDMDDTPALNRHPDQDCPTCGHPKAPYFEWISAFTVAELGEMLPWEIGGHLLMIVKGQGEYWSVYYDENHLGAGINKDLILNDQGAATESDARAKMLIYLIENKLITV